MNTKIKENFKGLIPFLVFIGFYLGSGVILDSMGVELVFYQLPAPIAVGLASMVTKAGEIEWIMSAIEKRIKGVKSAQIGMAILVTLTDMTVANNTVAIIINGPIAKKISERYKVDLKKVLQF